MLEKLLEVISALTCAANVNATVWMPFVASRNPGANFPFGPFMMRTCWFHLPKTYMGT